MSRDDCDVCEQGTREQIQALEAERDRLLARLRDLEAFRAAAVECLEWSNSRASEEALALPGAKEATK